MPYTLTYSHTKINECITIMNTIVIMINIIRCVSYGVLPEKEAKKLFATVQERKRSGKLLGSSSSAVTSPSPKKRKKIKSDPDGATKKKKIRL